ncbi:MAG TPA: aminotransferase class III-fold pyridoxal phosphate-dependent enzyme [Opitutales bacterium]|nr:aminotransferase class III-fold pyridoxal phosphate-dependent enzyme [Opitutales bacterium]
MSTTASTLRAIDKAHHIHPFTNNALMHTNDDVNVIVSAKGCYITDDKGRKLLDGLASLWCVNMGYGQQSIIDAVTKQLNTLCYYPSFFNSTTEPTILLAEKLYSLGLPRLTHTLFANSGSGANETAIKVALSYWLLKGKPEKRKILARTYAYHGVTMGATNLTGLASCTKPFALPTTNFVKCPGPYHYVSNSELTPEAFGQKCLDETEAIIKCEGADTFAALFAEPIQGAGGVIIPPKGYLKGLRELARKYNMLYVSDEVITGFGRTGAMFASDAWDLDPDILVLAKGITSGYIPLGATRISGDIAKTLNEGGYYASGHTYSGHPVACAAALANIALMEKTDIVNYVKNDIGPYFAEKLLSFKNHPAVGEARVCNLMGAIEILDHGKKVTDPYVGLGPKAAALIRKEGVIVRGLANLIAISPALIISKAEVDELFAAVKKGLDQLV